MQDHINSVDMTSSPNEKKCLYSMTITEISKKRRNGYYSQLGEAWDLGLEPHQLRARVCVSEDDYMWIVLQARKRPDTAGSTVYETKIELSVTDLPDGITQLGWVRGSDTTVVISGEGMAWWQVWFSGRIKLNDVMSKSLVSDLDKMTLKFNISVIYVIG